jgi:hypothetical protein
VNEKGKERGGKQIGTTKEESRCKVVFPCSSRIKLNKIMGAVSSNEFAESGNVATENKTKHPTSPNEHHNLLYIHYLYS